MKTFLLTTYLLILCVFSKAQIGKYIQSGPGSIGVQNTLLSKKDGFSGYNNPCQGIDGKSLSMGISAGRIYNLSEITNGSIVIGKSIKGNGFASVGVYLQNWGGGYNQINIFGSGALKLSEKYFMGLKINYFQDRFINYSSHSSLNGNLYLLGKINPKLNIGLSVQNPNFNTNKASLGASDFNSSYQTPMAFLISSSYQITKELKGFFEGQKSSATHLILKLGLMYEPNSKFDFSLGLRNIPNKIGDDDLMFTFGFNYHALKGISLCTAFEFHPYLGVSSYAGLQYISERKDGNELSNEK